ncbi:hypothetical protein Btru_075231 [Bulinus truncatus]|nr:hypothetical protein Btru_075231 [Bulinus truncatus]
MNALTSYAWLSICLALCQAYCEFPIVLHGRWSVPYWWDSISISETSVSGVEVKLAPDIVLNNFTCYSNRDNRYVIKSDSTLQSKGDHLYNLYLCWEFVRVTVDVFLLYQLTAQDGSTHNKTWTPKSATAQIKESDVCSTNVVSYLPFFRKDVELWTNLPKCPQFEVSQVVNCRENRYACSNVDHQLYKPVSSVMSCLSFRLRCAFLYLANTDIDGDKVVCVIGMDFSGRFAVGFNLGLCKYLIGDHYMSCDAADQLYPACSGSCLKVNEWLAAVITWSSIWLTVKSFL